MIKRILLLIAAVPLLWVMANEGHHLYKEQLTNDEGPVTVIPAELTTKLDKAQSNSAHFLVSDGIQKAVVCVTDKGFVNGNSEADQNLFPVLKRYALALENERRLIKALAKMDEGIAPDADWLKDLGPEHPYAKIIQQCQTIVEFNRELVELTKKYPDQAEVLKEKLKEYRKQPYHSDKLYKSAEAKIARKEHEAKYRKLPEQYNTALLHDRAELPRIKPDVANCVKALEQFVDLYSDSSFTLFWGFHEQLAEPRAGE